MNMDGWVFGDRASRYAEANIRADLGSTIVPADGAAVIYPATALGNPQRFRDAWGSGITLIPTSMFPTLNNSGGDRIGLWANHADYSIDAMSEPDWPLVVFEIDYATANDFPGVSGSGGPSIAWSGAGSISDGEEWEVSEAGIGDAFASMPTALMTTQINSSLDRGNPGVRPAGLAPTGLHITEIMYDPDSPTVSDGFNEVHFEWIEVFNNTGQAFDFATNNYVFDDIAGADLESANVTTGALANGQIGVLFNDAQLTVAEMQAAWGASLNFIPVSSWPSLNNSGSETIGLWASLDDYPFDGETEPPRTFEAAAASVQYDTRASEDWPTSDGRSSIYWNDLAADAANGENWTRSGSDDDDLPVQSASPIERLVADHPGGDVGSPGLAPGSIIIDPLFGDYNENARVDAADYTVWHDRFGAASMPNDLTPGSVAPDDYDLWKSAFGTQAGVGRAAHAAVPEPAGMAMLLCCFATTVFSGRDPMGRRYSGWLRQRRQPMPQKAGGV